MSLEAHQLDVSCAVADSRRAFRRKLGISAFGALAVTGGLAFELMGRRSQFTTALHSAPLWLLALAVVLQVAALVSRSEAWFVCVGAAGATVSRRVLFRAAGIGCLASILNGSVGMAVRIGSLRRSAPQDTPRVPALVAAEIPIVAVEVSLAAIFSFTLIAPLGAPWWVPLIAVAAMAAVLFGLRKLSERYREGLWAGLAVVRDRCRIRMIVFTLLAVCAQIARNWLILRALGVDVSIFDSMALLIAMFTIGQLPIGPSMGPAAAVLILGAHGVAVTAAAGVLLAVTGISGSICFAAWAIIDRVVSSRLNVIPEVVPAPAPPVVVINTT